MSSSFTVTAEDIPDDDYTDLSQASNQSQFRFDQDSDPNFENDSEYLPASEDESSQEFSQVQIYLQNVTSVPVYFYYYLQETSEAPENDYFGKEPIEVEKVIVYLPLLLTLLNICRLPNCGSSCDPANRKVHFSGAMVTISVTCNAGHDYSWKSSPTVGIGKSQVAAINVLLGAYAYLCGFNVKKVPLF